MNIVPTGSTVPLNLMVTAFGTGVTGLSASVALVRESDDSFWTGTGFTGTPTFVPMNEVDAINRPGLYSINFDQSIDNVENFYIAYYKTTGAFVGDATDEFMFSSINANFNPLAIAQAVAAKILVNSAIPINSANIAKETDLLEISLDVDNISNQMALQSTLTAFQSATAASLANITSILQPLTGTNQVTFTILDQNSNPVPNVLITLKNTTNQITLAFGQSNINGQLTLGLPSGTYNVLFFKSFYTFGTQPYVLTVTTNQTVTINAVSFIPLSVLPNMCALYSYVLDATGQPVAGVVVRMKMITTMPFASSGSSLIQSGWVEVQTDATGYWTINAIQGAIIEVSIPALLFDLSDFTVPVQANLDLSTTTGLVN
jgi:hypothetical protein